MKCMKKLICAAAAASLLAGCSTAGQTSTADGNETVYTIGLAQYMDHSSLNTIREAILEEFESEGYTDGENLKIDYQNGAGQISNLDTIMSTYAADDVDAIIAIATPAALSAQNYSTQIPVIFSAVSDPVGAGLVASLDEPGGSITGTSDEVQVDQIIDLILELTPDAKTVGVLYNAGEANSVSNVSRFKEYAAEKGLTVVEKTGTDLTTMQQAASDLVEQVDVLFSPNDNTVASAMAALGQIAVDAGVPYYVGADSMVETGGFATVGINYEELGRETAKLAIEVLQGADPAEIPVKVFKDDLNTYINASVLGALESGGKTAVSIPAELEGDDSVIMVDSSNTEE